MYICPMKLDFANGMRQRILFICLGNICRSPAAEGIFQHLVDERGLADQFMIDSAAIGPWHIGDLENLRAIRAKTRNKEDEQKIRLMADYLRHHPSHPTIPDPYYGSDRDFELVIDLLEDACEGLLDSF